MSTQGSKGCAIQKGLDWMSEVGLDSRRRWWITEKSLWFSPFLILIGCLASFGEAATIVVGDHEVVAGRTAKIPILIQREDGDPDLLGVELAIQIGDGTDGPVLGAVDLVSGTIFADNNTGSRDKGSEPRRAFWETTTAAGVVSIPESGLLATVEVDATGWMTGTFGLSLTSVAGASTVLFDDLANIVVPNGGAEIMGSFTIVPEPSGLTPCLGLGLAVLMFPRRRTA